MLWFYEHMSLGKWWPRTSPDAPVKRSNEGRIRQIRGVIEVDARHAHLSLNALREIYSRDGRFVGTQGTEHYKRVRGLE